MCWKVCPDASRGSHSVSSVMFLCLFFFFFQVLPSSTPSSTRASTSDMPTSAACLAPESILLRTPLKATSTCTGLVEARGAPPTKTAPATCATGETFR